MTERSTHLVVRIPMKGDPLETIVERHNEIASSLGSVWFGVRGQAPRDVRCMALMEQVGRKIPTFLYVAQIQDQIISSYQASLHAIQNLVPKVENNLIPPYYADLPTPMENSASVWLRVGEFKRVPTGALKSLQIELTGTSLIHVLTKSRGSVLIVSEDRNSLQIIGGTG